MIVEGSRYLAEHISGARYVQFPGVDHMIVACIAVHTGARVAANAQPGEVLVSGTVKDLLAGSGITFQDRGSHELKGIPGEWRLFAVER